MNKQFNMDTIRVAKHNNKNNFVIAIGYDFQSKTAICGSMILLDERFMLENIKLQDLTFYNLKDTNDLISSENIASQDLKAGLGYLLHFGIDHSMWDTSWGLFDWKSLDKTGGIRVFKQP